MVQKTSMHRTSTTMDLVPGSTGMMSESKETETFDLHGIMLSIGRQIEFWSNGSLKRTRLSECSPWFGDSWLEEKLIGLVILRIRNRSFRVVVEE